MGDRVQRRPLFFIHKINSPIRMSHTSTLIIPLVFALPALLFLISSMIKASSFREKLSMILYILTFLSTTLTSALGGSSMRKTEVITGVNLKALSLHAWFGATSFVLSVLLLFFAIKILRKNKKLLYSYILMTTLIYLAFYSISIFSSGQIF